MASQPSEEDIREFEQNRGQLVSISNHKQQLSAQAALLGKAIEELEKTSEKKVYKAVGNIMILSDVDATKKELSETKENIDLRVKTLQKQEDSLVQKLNKLKFQIEGGSRAEESPAKSESENSKKALKSKK